MDFPKKQAQRLMPLYLLEYSEKLFENHPDPEAPWGGGGDYTAGYGIDITNDEISVDTEVIATKSDIASMVTTTMLEDALDDYALKTDIPENVSDLNNDAGYITSNALSGYIKDNDSNYSAIFRGQYAIVKASGAYTTTTYGDGVIGRTLPYGLPGYTYSLPDKNGTFAMIEDIPSLSGYATESWVNNQGFISSTDLSNYVTSSELSNQLSNYALSSTVTNLASQVTTLESLVSNHTTQINSINSNITDLQTLTSTHTSQISGINSSVTSLESLVNTNISSISTIQNNLNSLGSQVTTLEGLVSTNTSNISAIQSSISNMGNTHPFYRVTDDNNVVFFSLDGTEGTYYKWLDITGTTYPVNVNLQALNPKFESGLVSGYSLVDSALHVSLDPTITSRITTLEGLTSTHTSQISALQSSVSNCVTVSQLSTTLSDYALKSEVPSVVANPATTTQTLSALQIDGVGYSIAGGGGGASYSLSKTFETWTFTLSDNTTITKSMLMDVALIES